MAQTDNELLIPGSLYKLKHGTYWPIYHKNEYEIYKDFDIKPNEILLFLKKIEVRQLSNNIKHGYLFLHKDSIIVVAYDYFYAIVNKTLIKL